MDRLTKIILIYTFAALPLNALALEYEVEWPPSTDPRYFTLVITIEKCETMFKIPTKQLDNFANSEDHLSSSVELAMKRYKNACK